jgi:hypothetical protein
LSHYVGVSRQPQFDSGELNASRGKRQSGKIAGAAQQSVLHREVRLQILDFEEAHNDFKRLSSWLYSACVPIQNQTIKLPLRRPSAR